MRKSVCRSALLLLAALPACSLAGTGSATGDTGRARALEYGTAALDDGDYAAAAEQLAPVAAICPSDELGSRALLLLAAAELDGRNADGRPDAAAELAAFHLARTDEDDWSGALAEELYVIALDLGADPIEPDEVPDAGVIWSRYLATVAAEAAVLGDEAAVDTLAGADARAERERETRARRAAAMTAGAEGGPRCRVPDVRDDLVMPELERTPIASRTAPGAQAQQPAALSSDVRALQAEVQRLRGELASREQELDRIRRTLRP